MTQRVAVKPSPCQFAAERRRHSPALGQAVHLCESVMASPASRLNLGEKRAGDASWRTVPWKNRRPVR